MLHKSILLSVGSLLLLYVCLLTISCNDKLSRSEAAKLISENETFSEPLKGSIAKEGGRIKDDPLQSKINKKLYEALVSLGYIEVTGGFGIIESFNLTEKAQKELSGWQTAEGVYKIPVIKREIVEVTGISEPKSGENTVQATFKWQVKPIGEIGKIMMNDDVDKSPTSEGNAILQKFDDGWRVMNISGPGLSFWETLKEDFDKRWKN